jgi:hypothetical protein
LFQKVVISEKASNRRRLESGRHQIAGAVRLHFPCQRNFQRCHDLFVRSDEEASVLNTQRTGERRRVVRGAPYSPAEFQRKYGLDDATAEDLFARFGPSSIELDLLMAAKRRIPSFNELTKELPLP